MASNRKKAKLFNIKHIPMDLARVLCFAAPMFFNTKKIYVSPAAKKKIRGGMFIASNHTCTRDPLIVSCCFWYRRMFHLTAEAVMENKFIGLLLKGVGCIKINRNICDIESIKKAVNVVNKGHVMAIFPQGGIKDEDEINSIKSGVILMAMQAKVPILPCYIHNKSGKGDRNCIVIGEPLEFFSECALPSMQNINEYAQCVLEKMTECKKIYEESRRK